MLKRMVMCDADTSIIMHSYMHTPHICMHKQCCSSCHYTSAKVLYFVLAARCSTNDLFIVLYCMSMSGLSVVAFVTIATGDRLCNSLSAG